MICECGHPRDRHTEAGAAMCISPMCSCSCFSERSPSAQVCRCGHSKFDHDLENNTAPCTYGTCPCRFYSTRPRLIPIVTRTDESARHGDTCRRCGHDYARHSHHVSGPCVLSPDCACAHFTFKAGPKERGCHCGHTKGQHGNLKPHVCWEQCCACDKFRLEKAKKAIKQKGA